MYTGMNNKTFATQKKKKKEIGKIQSLSFLTRECEVFGKECCCDQNLKQR